MTEENFILNPMVKNNQDNSWMYIFDPRGPEVYTGDIKNAIDIVTLDKDQPPKIVGSFKYRVHRYPGDIDMLEFYEGCCTLTETKKDIVKKLQDIAVRIKQHKGVYLGDFKAGEDERFKLDIGTVVNGTVTGYNKENIIAAMNKLYDEKLLKKEQMLKLYDLLVDKPSQKEYKNLSEAIRKLYVVRWNVKEILDGKKKLVGNKTIYLRDAISQGTIVKIDIFIKINGRYTEVTNFFALSSRDANGELIPLTEEFADYKESLRNEINQLIKDDKYLKVAKRLWLLALNNKRIDYLQKLYPLFSSPAAELRQMAAEAETLAAMLEKVKNPPFEEIRQQIDGFKLRIADISSTVLSDGTRRILYDLVDDASWSTGSVYIIEHLTEFEDILRQIYDSYSKVYLEAIGLDKMLKSMCTKKSELK